MFKIYVMNKELPLNKLEKMLESRSMEELTHIWEKNNQSSQSEQIFNLISEIFTKRNQAIPPRTKFQPKSKNIPTDINASANLVGPTKCEIKFPKDGYMRPGQSNFKHQEEINAYLTKAFLQDYDISNFSGGTIRRSGKYQRIDEKGDPIFTFGDPISGFDN